MKEEALLRLKKKPLAPAPAIIVTSSSSSEINIARQDVIIVEKGNQLVNGEDDEGNEMALAPPEAEMITDRQERKNWLLALILLMVYIALVVTSSQLTSSAFNDKGSYKAPFLFIWCKVFMQFPSVFLIQSLIRLCKRQPMGIRDQWQRSTRAFRLESRDGNNNRVSAQIMTKVWIFLKKFFPMSITMLLMQIGWVVGLVHAPASIITALCSATIAFSYLLSWIVLKNKMLLIKGLFVIVAFVGIGLISYASTMARYSLMNNATNGSIDALADAFSGNASAPAVFTTTSFEGANVYLGVACGIAAAIFYSLHGLAFKLAFRKTDLMDVSLIMSVMSFFICVIYFPVPVILNIVKYEEWQFEKMPLHIMFTSWFFAYISSVSYAYGLSLSNPFFMSVGEVLIVALSTGIDSFIRGINLNEMQIAGTALVALAFIFMVMPDHWISVKLIRIRNDQQRNGGLAGIVDSAELQELNPKSPAKDSRSKV